ARQLKKHEKSTKGTSVRVRGARGLFRNTTNCASTWPRCIRCRWIVPSAAKRSSQRQCLRRHLRSHVNFIQCPVPGCTRKVSKSAMARHVKHSACWLLFSDSLSEYLKNTITTTTATEPTVLDG
ncbi:conserved hypothetical protein, partial [Trichinella spiralis]|uniref:hypothetical protein n=1 Tax=Trichinella spiralis TaxID=6334 RepID=UPI0001EFED3F